MTEQVIEHRDLISAKLTAVDTAFTEVPAQPIDGVAPAMVNQGVVPAKANDGGVLAKGLKIFGEVVLTPGTSLLLDGQLKPGIAHVGVGFVARRMLGLPGLLLVGANSYSQSVTGKSLLTHVQALTGSADDSLGELVKKAVSEKKSLSEILATIAEDVEDKYLTHSK
jgi:hypothetical protein